MFGVPSSRAMVALGLLLALVRLAAAQQAQPSPSRVPASAAAAPEAKLTKAIAAPVTDYGQLVRLLDSRTPMSEREGIFAQICDRADAGNTAFQYFVGSLYRAGDHVKGSPVSDDLDKARLYLSNAAIHGHLFAMAKMSELSLDAGELQAAMDWAQIFAYYVSRTKNDSPAYRRYIAELTGRISKQMGRNKRDEETLSDLNDFIATHGADVSAGLAVNRQIQILPHDPFLQVNRHFALPKAGFADFIVSLKPDGSVGGVWSLDGTPDFSLTYALAPNVEKLKTPPRDTAGTTYAWFAQAFDDVECLSCWNAYKRSKQ